MTEKHRTKRRRGRPVTKPLPERIPDTAENVLRAVMATPPKGKRGWRYQKTSGKT